MKSAAHPITAALALATVLVLCSDPAYALRCGTKLVKDGMYEVEVRRLCGEPISVRHVGFVLRAYRYKYDRYYSRTLQTYHPQYGYHQELAVTELLYNFGPRKLMRILRFEGDRLASIETAGYGYFEKAD